MPLNLGPYNPRVAPARVILVDFPQPYRSRHETRKDNPEHKTKFGIGVAQRYNMGVMTEEGIAGLGEYIKRVAADDAYIFCWSTVPNRPFTARLLGETGRSGLWGCEYKTTPICWVKTYPNGSQFKGPGSYGFSNIEDVWLARYPKTALWHGHSTPHKPEQVIEEWPSFCHECGTGLDLPTAEIREPHPRESGKIAHSVKPETVQDRISAWLDPFLGPYSKVEIFATRFREPRNGEIPWTCMGGDLSGRDIREDLEDYARRLDDIYG